MKHLFQSFRYSADMPIITFNYIEYRHNALKECVKNEFPIRISEIISFSTSDYLRSFSLITAVILIQNSFKLFMK